MQADTTPRLARVRPGPVGVQHCRCCRVAFRYTGGPERWPDYCAICCRSSRTVPVDCPSKKTGAAGTLDGPQDIDRGIAGAPPDLSPPMRPGDFPRRYSLCGPLIVSAAAGTVSRGGQ